MILINLLPHREESRRRQKSQFFTQLGLAALLGGAIALGAFAWYQAQISEQQGRNSFLTSEIAKLDEEIKDIKSLQAQIASLRARQTAVEQLQSNRNLPVHLLQELVEQLPDGIYLSSIKQENENVLMTGAAQSQERVSELLRNLGKGSTWLNKPELVEIVAANVTFDKKEQKRVSNFSVRVRLKDPTAKDNPDDGLPATGAKAPKKV